LLAGPPGSGRTRLLSEFAVEMYAAGVAVFYGRLGPGICVLDDLDEGMAALLSAVGGDAPMLCVAAYDPNTVSRAVRGALLASRAEELALSRLDRTEVAEIVTSVAGPVDADLVAEIAAAADGWPGAVE